MSKKHLTNRLNAFFAQLDENATPPISKVDDSPCWNWEIDADGNFLSISPEVSDALGLPVEAWIGQSFYQFHILPQSGTALQELIQVGQFPAEIEIYHLDQANQQILHRVMIYAAWSVNGVTSGWYGFTQTIVQDDNVEQPSSQDFDQLPQSQSHPSQRLIPPLSTSPSFNPGIAERDMSSTQFWTETGKRSFATHKVIAQKGSSEQPATLAVPFLVGNQGSAILEIQDENGERSWSENDQLLVEEVSRQLSQALENARLYASVQQELTERVKAEQEILRRSQDLAVLNQAGQQLSQLASRQEILTMVQDSIGRLMDHRNLTIVLLDSKTQSISVPIHTQNGQNAPFDPQLSVILDHIFATRNPLLITSQMASFLTENGIPLPDPLPLSLMAIPLFAGDLVTGAFLLTDFEKENAYSPDQLELLSTIASQATTALQNTNLFQEIRNALQSLETRERYQGNVARAVALLTESGTRALSDVLNAVGQASAASRVYYAEVKEDSSGPYWHAVVEWVNPSHETSFTRNNTQRMRLADLPHWVEGLRERGWTGGNQSQLQSPEKEFLSEQNINSSLLIAVPGKNANPGFIAIDQIGEERVWQNEEINVLRVAADAVGNTFIREDLLDQLQVSLDETETLYNASHRLALANDLNEMVEAVAVSLNAPAINRSVLALFQMNEAKQITGINVEATWSSGRGTPPPVLGTGFPITVFEKAFTSSAPIFYNDIFESRVPSNFRDTLTLDHVRSVAILPLWIGKRQLGVLLIEAEEKHIFTGREIRSYPPLVDQMATAVENQRLFQQTQTALSETGLLYEISQGISNATKTDDLITLVGSRLMPRQAQKAGIWQVTQTDSAGQPLEFDIVGCYQTGEGCHAIGMRIPVQQFPLWTQANNATFILNSLEAKDVDPISRQTLTNLGMQSGIFVPLLSGRNLIGFLACASDQPATYSEDEVRMLQVASGGVSVALEKQRLLNEAQKRALELQTAAEIARDTTSTLSTDLLLERMVNLIRDRFSFYHVSIFLLDDEKNFAVIQESTGEAGQALKERHHRLAVGSRSVIGSATSTGTTICINDVSQSPLYYPNPLLPETRSETGIPLKLGERVIGALDLQSNNLNAFTPNDLTVLQILSDQIAIAIENARAYELSQKAYEEMKEVDRLKSQFLANMSHELRTPLNSIIGFSRVILKGIDGPINDTQKQDLSAIFNSGQHLLSLINNILDRSKIEAGKMELQISDVNLADLINSVMSTAAGLVTDRPIKLQLFIPEGLPTIQADNTRIRQVLLNFISNAVKFTEEGSITVEASLAISPSGKDEVMVTITDTGSGVAAEDQYKLFQPFSQVDDSPTRKTGGTGLGLSICRSFIEMHNGRIGLLRSKIDQGSTFFFTLPLPETENPTQADHETNVILSIDDDPQVVSLYQRYLRPLGFRVIPVTNPREAVEKAKEFKPYAITLDIMMPDVDGWSVMQALKGDPLTRNIPILICSILEEEEKGFSLGAADYLVKPFLQEDLSNAVNRLNFDGKIHSILIIDDDPADIRVVQKMLDQKSFEIRTAEGGKAGWEAIQTNPPDAVILDLFMPDMNGFAILSHLKTDAKYKDIAVIILTGADLSAEDTLRINSFGQGMLTKGGLRESELLNTLVQSLKRIR